MCSVAMSYQSRFPLPASSHPADELGQIRNEIRALKTREDMLRKAMLRDHTARVGQRYEVVVSDQKRRVFLRDRLPPEILSQPDYWEERVSTVVKTRKTNGPHPGRPVGSAGPEDEEFEVIERF